MKTHPCSGRRSGRRGRRGRHPVFQEMFPSTGDSWNDVPERAKLFFNWVATLDKTIIEILDDNNVEYTRSIGNIIGNTLVEDYYKLTSPRTIDRGPKPWKLK